MTEQLNYISQNKPAASIDTLVEYLKSLDTEDYVYRGQIKDYGVLAPSGVRGALTGNELTEGMLELDIHKSFTGLDERGKAKSRLMTNLVNRFGKGLGNILAQQYGLSTECLDVTRDVDIASFFATRKYPTYEHYSSEENTDIGVIYRYKYDKFSSDISGLNFTIDIIGTRVNSYEAPVWFMKYVYERDLSTNQIIDLLEECKHEQKILFTHPITLAHEDMFRYIEDHNSGKFEEYQVQNKIYYNNTRLKAQCGGFFIPSYYHKCACPADREVIRPNNINRNLFKPGWAISRGIIAVDNLVINNKVKGSDSSLDAFYFKHSDLEINKVKREELWPDRNKDRMFDLILQIAEEQEKSYLKKIGIRADDQNNGLIDRGYYD